MGFGGYFTFLHFLSLSLYISLVFSNRVSLGKILTFLALSHISRLYMPHLLHVLYK